MENIEYVLIGLLFISQIVTGFMLIRKTKNGKLENIKGDKLMKVLEEKIDKISKEIEHYNSIIESSKKLDKEDGKKIERILSKKLDSLKKDLLTLDSSKKVIDKLGSESKEIKSEIKISESSILNRINKESTVIRNDFIGLTKVFNEKTTALSDKVDDKFKRLERNITYDLEEKFDGLGNEIKGIKEELEGNEGKFKKLEGLINTILTLLRQEGIEIRNIIPPSVDDEKVFTEMQESLVAAVDSLVNNSRHLALNYKDLESLPQTKIKMKELEEIRKKKETLEGLIKRLNEIKEEKKKIEEEKLKLDSSLKEKNNELNDFKDKSYYDTKLSELTKQNGDKKELENSIRNMKKILENKKEKDKELSKYKEGKEDLLKGLPGIDNSKLDEENYLKTEINKIVEEIENLDKEGKKEKIKDLKEKKENLDSLDDTLSQIKNLEKELKDLEGTSCEDLEKKEKKLEEVKKEIVKLEKIKLEKEKFDELNTRIEELNTKIKKNINEFTKLTQESNEKTKELGLEANNE